jgi:exopolysaccharide production protein ExoQ
LTLTRLPSRQITSELDGHAAANLEPALRYLTWSICFLSLTALLFANAGIFQTMAILVFLFAATFPVLIFPRRSLTALFGDWLPWLYVVLAVLSISWSQEPDVSIKFAIEFALTVAAALVLAGTVEPHAFISALMCSYLVGDVLGFFFGRYALNAGAEAMIGIYGSKNAFSAAQAYLFLSSWWVLVSVKHSLLMRLLALGSVLVCPVLLLLGRSADAVAPLLLAIPITFVIYLTARWPSLSRILAVGAGFSLIVIVFAIAFVFWDAIFGHLLVATGKEVTLSGRTYMWAWASTLISQHPLLGTGYGAFWVQGNPYAEEIWAHFQNTGRGGFNFHNQWYDVGVSLGYVGLFVALLTVLIITLRNLRWVVRDPSPESCFFTGFVWIVNIRSFLESESFAHFSTSWLLYIAAAHYARTEVRKRLAPSEQIVS